jgi:two-component system chemotaxis response regulator CheY
MDTITAIVIDDEPSIQEVISDVLEMIGVKIVGVGSDGNDAIRLYKKESPMIVFMDVNMPNMDGLEALKKIKKIDSHSTVVMVTGNSSLDIEKELERAGATATIIKPFSIEKMIKVFEEVKPLLRL